MRSVIRTLAREALRAHASLDRILPPLATRSQRDARHTRRLASLQGPGAREHSYDRQRARRVQYIPSVDMGDRARCDGERTHEQRDTTEDCAFFEDFEVLELVRDLGFDVELFGHVSSPTTQGVIGG